jgi:hypothetical protein
MIYNQLRDMAKDNGESREKVFVGLVAKISVNQFRLPDGDRPGPGRTDCAQEDRVPDVPSAPSGEIRGSSHVAQRSESDLSRPPSRRSGDRPLGCPMLYPESIIKIVSARRHPASDLFPSPEHDGLYPGRGVLHDGLSDRVS